MNVALDAKRFFYNHTGLGNYSRRFVAALIDVLAHENIKIQLYTPKINDENGYLGVIKNQPTIKIITPKKWYEKLWGGALWRAWLINNDLKNNNIDVYYGLSNEIPLNIHRIKSIKTVVIIHDLILYRYPELFPKIDRWIYQYKTKYACRHAHHIVVPSVQTQRDIMDFLGVDGDKISVLPPICDAIYNNKTAAVLPPAWHINKKYLLSVGDITPRKNLLKTVEAWLQIQQHTDIDLVIVGTAVGLGKGYLAQINRLIDVAKPKNAVHFLGKMDIKYMPYIYQNAEMLVYPSIFEGFGMPIVEALCSHTPVITSAGGCFGEAGGGGALYVNHQEKNALYNAITQLLTDPILYKKLTTEGQKHAEKFNSASIKKDVLKLHNKVAQTP